MTNIGKVSTDRRSPEQFEQIAEAAAMKAVRQTLISLGIDPDDEVEAQQDFAMLRKMRRAREKGAAAAVWLITVTLVGGMLTLVWQAITAKHDTPAMHRDIRDN